MNSRDLNSLYVTMVDQLETAVSVIKHNILFAD